MVEYLPQVLRGWEAAIDGYEGLPVSDSSLFDELELVSTFDEADVFIDRLCGGWHWRSWWGIEIPDDLQAVRDVMHAVLTWRSLLNENPLDNRSLGMHGVSYVVETEFAEDDGGFPLETPMVFARYKLEVPKGTYGKMPDYEPRAWAHLDETEGGAFLAGGAIRPAGAGEAENNEIAVSACIDTVFSYHLAGIKTAMLNGRVVQDATHPVSALWLSMGHALHGSRVLTCGACGRPLLASRERGKPRKFCNDNCRQWHHKHKHDGAVRDDSSVLKG